MRRGSCWDWAWPELAAVADDRDRPVRHRSAATPPSGRPSRAAGGPAHPWYVRPDLGPWMICVKSYSGPESRKLAETLAAEIRRTHNAGAYLFEWGSEERQQEEERRKKAKEEFRRCRPRSWPCGSR